MPREMPVLSAADARPRLIDSGERFEELFRRHYAPLFGLAYRLVGDPQEAEDLIQEAFLRLAPAAVVWRPDDEVAAWLRRVTLNLGFNRLRDLRRSRERLEMAARLQPEEAADNAAPAMAVLRQEACASVRRALTTLPERQRECLLLRHAGYSYNEIAATIGVAVGSVGVLLARAERAFRSVYTEDYDELP